MGLTHVRRLKWNFHDIYGMKWNKDDDYETGKWEKFFLTTFANGNAFICFKQIS